MNNFKIQLIDITPNPIEKIYKSYRICYSSLTWDEIPIPNTLEEMYGFIIPLMEECHNSPLEQVNFTVYIQNLSRAALAQITRHRSARFNVQSQRYVDGKFFTFIAPDLKYLRELERLAAENFIENSFAHIKDGYEELVKLGVKKEDARAILPQATTCNLIMNIDIHNFRNMLRQRLCSHAQLEIRELAKEITKLIKIYVPFVDHKVLLCQQGLCKKPCKNKK